MKVRVIFNETLSLDQAQVATSDEAEKAINQTIITLSNISSSREVVASLAGAVVESDLQIEELVVNWKHHH